ncbi:hypothetical protein [Microbispora sp. NPDC049125]|uniref:hypothetical protein n=1 Tax=Microbispora sp. NPDC049125 TaxID=3154929 RepID=UPI0034651F75
MSLAAGSQLFVEPQLLSQASNTIVPNDYSLNQLAYQYAFLPFVMLPSSDGYPIQVGLTSLLTSTPAFNPALPVPSPCSCRPSPSRPSSPAGLTVDQEFEDGGILLGEEPGLGIQVDESWIRSLPTRDHLQRSTGRISVPTGLDYAWYPDARE